MGWGSGRAWFQRGFAALHACRATDGGGPGRHERVVVGAGAARTAKFFAHGIALDRTRSHGDRTCALGGMRVPEVGGGPGWRGRVHGESGQDRAGEGEGGGVRTGVRSCTPGASMTSSSGLRALRCTSERAEP